MAVVSFHPGASVYREEQNFEWWIYALLAVLEVLAWAGLFWAHRNGPPAAVLAHLNPIELVVIAGFGLLLPAILVVAVFRMTTEVTPTDLRVWFGWIPTFRRAILLGEIRRIEVVSYRPIADYGGWGIRVGRDGVRVLNARGNRGVRIDLADGTKLLIGSQRPEALALVLESSIRPSV